MRLLNIQGNSLRSRLKSAVSLCCNYRWEDERNWLDNCRWKEPIAPSCCSGLWSNSSVWINSCIWDNSSQNNSCAWNDSSYWVAQDPFISSDSWDDADMWSANEFWDVC